MGEDSCLLQASSREAAAAPSEAHLGTRFGENTLEYTQINCEMRTSATGPKGRQARHTVNPNRARHENLHSCRPAVRRPQQRPPRLIRAQIPQDAP